DGTANSRKPRRIDRRLHRERWRARTRRASELSVANPFVGPERRAADRQVDDAPRLLYRVRKDCDALICSSSDHDVRIEERDRAGWVIKLSVEVNRFAGGLPRRRCRVGDHRVVLLWKDLCAAHLWHEEGTHDQTKEPKLTHETPPFKSHTTSVPADHILTARSYNMRKESHALPCLRLLRYWRAKHGTVNYTTFCRMDACVAMPAAITVRCPRAQSACARSASTRVEGFGCPGVM